MFAGMGWVHRQRQVDKQLAQEEIATGLAVQYQGVFTDPAQAGLFGDGFFQYRRAVDEGAITEGADDCLNFSANCCTRLRINLW